MPLGCQARRAKQEAGYLQPDGSALVPHQGSGHWAMGARASLSSHGPPMEHESLDLSLKPPCGLLSRWWPQAAHTSLDLAARAGSLQCWSCPGPQGWQGPCVTPGDDALPQGLAWNCLHLFLKALPS